RERNPSAYGGACIWARRRHHTRRSTRPCLRTRARHRFPRAEIRCTGVANESGIFALLAAGKLGSLHYPATIFESARADQPTASCQTEQYTRGIRGRTLPRAGRDDVAG